MTIKEVCEQYKISQDTLRYYERVGAIPEVNRTSGGAEVTKGLSINGSNVDGARNQVEGWV